MEALLNTCELIGVDPRDIMDAAYRRLIAEMGEYNLSSDSGDANTRDYYDMAAKHGDIEAERAADEMADRIAANPDDFDVAANDDPNKENEATTPRE